MKEKSFDEVNSMLLNGEERKVRGMLVDPDTGRIKREYAWDRNHAWYCVGDADFKMGKYKDAIKSFRKAYGYDSDDVQCLLAIGNCFDAIKEPKKAENILKKALDIGLKGKVRSAVIFNLGNALFDQERFDEAIAYYLDVKNRRDEIGKKARKNIKLILDDKND